MGQEKDGHKEITPHTGTEYERQEMGSADARRDALPRIEQAVAEGGPCRSTPAESKKFSQTKTLTIKVG
ncbi:hypothetical protein [Streptomyces sp. AS02]|uniref:hypothetical protein n=1 Tax=Streptomyces sp. AS02 TaxID=2938946 RepID=UPI00201FFF3B|nr:hypothetical protein [Streptomyces sp. AS02]MCL8016818.1 hypothetical protein [Streptomyces sp. AS02]